LPDQPLELVRRKDLHGATRFQRTIAGAARDGARPTPALPIACSESAATATCY